MKKRAFVFTLVIEAVLLGAGSCDDQLELEETEQQPIQSLENIEGKGRIETPQVVLQLKYDDGELDKIYLAQFRKGTKSTATLSVKARTNLCSDLCHAGLGGQVCGTGCLHMLPVGLKIALNNTTGTSNKEESQYGEPRTGVCPTLCEYNLGIWSAGQPLCNCPSAEVRVVDWNGICTAFCLSDRYVLRGCPPCEDVINTNQPQLYTFGRILNSVEGWTAWCNTQCKAGHGGAACNCDRTPF